MANGYAKYSSNGSGGSGGGVSSLNGETGAITLTAGTGITVTPAGSNITIAATGSGGGTVTSASVVTANGFAGSTASPTTTPAFTLSTTLTTPVIAGNGTALIAATTTGSGAVVLATSPTLVTPALGTPSALVGTNITGTASGLTAGNVTTNANLTGMVTSVGNVTTVVTNANLTGDVTSVGNATTLATVNSNTGSFGSSTSIPNLTVNAKGLLTAAGSNVVIAPAGTLSGTTLNSTVVTSSLTSVGTIGSGVWQGTPIGSAYVVTLNQNTTGTASNITASSNTSLTSLANLATVGTITTGVWNGTIIDVPHGGTGLATLTANNVILGNGTSTPTFVAPGTTGNGLVSNGTTWTSAPILASTPTSEIWLWAQNGYGSTNIMVRRWTNIGKNAGSDLTLTQSSVNGDLITINTAGVYAISYSDDCTGNMDAGIVLNGTQGTIPIYTLTSPQTIIAIGSNHGGGYAVTASCTLHLSVNDFIWAQNDGGAASAFPTGSLRVTRVS